MNETERKRSGDKPLVGLITELGSSPIISPFAWIPFGWSFITRLVLLNRIAIHPFFVVSPSNDLFNSSRVLLTVKKLIFVFIIVAVFVIREL